MAKVTIDGQSIEVPEGTTILQAARMIGGENVRPAMCYYTKLKTSGGYCRTCIVKVSKGSDKDPRPMPKLVPSCRTTVMDGMEVQNNTSPEVLEARKGVVEFLLINHPLDCPICDQAGECHLQDYVFQEGRARTRYTPTYAKRFNPVEDFGGDVLYVPNRCILCTRCVRFMEHVAEEPILNVSERGDRAYIGIHPDRRLDHTRAGNLVDLCPVGSLLSKDFLHKARAWELDKTA